MQSASVTYIISVLVIAVGWEAIGRFDPGLVFFIGSPFAVVRELYLMIAFENFIYHFLITGFEALSGLILGTLGGSLLGLACWYDKRVSAVLRPTITMIGSMPVLAFAPLMIVWFGVGLWLKIALAAITTFFISFTQAVRGADAVAKDTLDILRAMRATEREVFVKVIVPGSLDGILSSMRLNTSLCLLGAFVGEFISSDQGLGHLILRAGSLYNTSRAIGAAFGIAALALLFDFAARAIERRREELARLLSVPAATWSARHSTRRRPLEH